jgi:glycosyltransferase involved in cell wall biosynthesis
MRVAVFTDNDFEKVNGVTTTLKALVAHAPPDVRPRIYTADRHGASEPDYFAVRSLGMPIPFYSEMKMYVPHWRAYRDRVAADGVEVLHLTTPGPMGLTALRVASVTGLPLVGSFHTDLEAYTSLLSGSPRLGRWFGAYMRWMYGRCQRVLVPSAATRAMLQGAGTRSDRLALWTRGVDTRLFTPDRRSNAQRQAWGVSDRTPALLYVGRVSREKGLEMLPAMLDCLRGRGVPHRLIVAGDGPLRPWLMKRCPGALFLGSLDRERVASAFACGDVFVFPSQTDTAGNVVLEAQASGLPVVVSAAGGPCENMLSERTGIVCAEHDAAAWATPVSALLGDAERRRRMAGAAREYALTRSWESALATVYGAYRAARLGAAQESTAVYRVA